MSDSTSALPVDEEIYNCLNLDEPKSFFLFAGAGSGKTRSLVEVLKKFRAKNINRLKRNGQKVAIITYTNAACDEIKRRLEFDSAFNVSTIHSFAWGLIKPYSIDIKKWLVDTLQSEIKDLEEKQSRIKKETKTSIDRANKIKSKTRRLEVLANIKSFSYNPNGDNASRDSLNHAEVIKIAAEFILNRPLMQNILVHKYPILFIDESQDTKKELVEAFFNVQQSYSDCFALGMFGDAMQRIYMDGKTDLGQNIPDTWLKPAKVINHRCPKRVITLINKIRSETDDQTQSPANNSIDGIVRIFIVEVTEKVDKAKVEAEVASNMADITGDSSWNAPHNDVKILTLEHHMAAKRGGFSSFFDPLYNVDKLKTGLLDGTLPGISLFANKILALMKEKSFGNKFAEARIVRKYSPILKKDALQNSSNSIGEITKANEAACSLLALWNDENDPSLNDILKEVYNSSIFQVPDTLIPIAKRLSRGIDIPLENPDEESDKDKVIDAWDESLQCSFSQFEEYVNYISDQSRFGTHQGIKGLEFPRVMVILDDDEARGFLFSYEKLFGAKAPTSTDIKNEQEGKETSFDRTRRLFYVTCSRAEESLAIVAYTKEPQKVKEYIESQGWLEKEEIIEIGV